MFALVQKKKEWERQNREVLLRLVQTSTDVSVESVKAAGLVTSFLIYLIYKMIRGMLALGALMFVGPQLIRHIGPGHEPQEFHEFNQRPLESQIKPPNPWR